MEGPGQFYTQSMYGRDYTQFSALSGYGQQHSTCVYGSKSQVPAGYGAQTMTVVEHGLGGMVTGERPAADGGGTALPPHLSSVSVTLAASHAHSHAHSHGLGGGAAHPAHLGLPHTQLQAHHVPLQQQQPQSHPPAAHHQQQTHNIRHDNKNSSSSSSTPTTQPTLHFPWMKTTKSHAHQWKANWSGKYKV